MPRFKLTIVRPRYCTAFGRAAIIRPLLLSLLVLPLVCGLDSSRQARAAEPGASGQAAGSIQAATARAIQAAAEAGAPGTAAPDPGRTLNLDFNNVDISEVIRFFSEITGRNIIVDQRVAGKVTAYSPTPISIDEAYQVFLSIMEMNGFRVSKTEGDVYRIMPEAESRVAAPIGDEGVSERLPAELVTRVIPLLRSNAAELGKSLPEMLGNQGTVAVYAPSNTLIVTTSASLMEKVLAVVNEVDQGQNQPSFRSFALEYANARIVAEQIDRMLQARTRRGENANEGQTSFAVVVGDDRTGRLVVVADPESMSIIESSIASFDLPTTPGKGDMRVIPLEFASAENLATVITNLVSTQNPGGGVSSSASGTAAAGQAERVLMSEVSVVADTTTNSLLVAASPRDFDTIRELVYQLDVERRQIYVEAMVAEVSTEITRTMGINWYAGGSQTAGGRDYLIFGGSRTGGGSLGTSAMGSFRLLEPPSGGSLGIISAPIKFAGMDFSNLNILANFMRTDNRFHILATPQLMTLDNEEATVVVAENLPFLTQSAQGASTTDRVLQSVDYRDVGITLKILPQVSGNGNINLKVQQIVSRVASSGVVSAGQVLAMPTTRRREVNTRVLLENGQTLVIAGLIAKETNDNTSRVPGLGDIPAMGWLFKSEEDTDIDTNLLLFITPRMIMTKDEAMALEASKRRILYRIETGDDGSMTAARMPMRTLPPRLEPAL